MAAEGKAPSLAEVAKDEYSLPSQEVQLQNPSEEKSAVSTVAEVVPEKSVETAPANEATVAVEETSQTPEVKEPSDEPEAEESSAAEESGEAAEESSDAAEEAADEKPEIKIETAPADFRFPTTNQTRHCFTRYIEYHRCVAAKGEGAPECEKFAKYYRSLCPSEWIERWNEQRENGTFPGPL
ncbi:cytochrome c oxidase subunit 6b-1 isoform X1 [Setaria italica]|uniref:cytochrome c oxidase subunit 6b-1 isoform X1 n=1 Tax=Setaria italica TaxID=4555 RepID=UPI000BE5413F|nr:cytochrome c oxidase subunit 6b-1 isoform X1 [Setaria italica]